MKKTDLLFRPTGLNTVFIVSLFALGAFHEYLCALLSLALFVLMTVRFRRNKALRFSLSPVNLILVLFPFLYLLTSLWAADKGVAPMGFVKFLPLSLFTLLLSDREEERDGILALLPFAGAAQTVLSAALMQIPALKGFFSVSGRLAGFFQYPNTFALFLLMGLLVLLTKERLGAVDFICLAVLVFGILYSGSRTTLVLTVLFAAAAVATGRNKKVKWAALIGVIALIAAAGIYAVAGGGYRTFGRFLSISLSESTLLGRLLYWKDGLRLFAGHPFGIGYMGWYFMQFPNQTGVYTVQFVHNDYLQILLDVGVIGFALFALALGFSFFSRRADRRRRLMLLAFGGHLLMDFDLQFVAMWFLLALLTYTPSDRRIAIEKKAALAVPGAVLAVFSLWLGLSQGLYHFKLYEPAAAVWQGNTFAQIAVMQQSSGTDRARETADRILKNDPYIAAAYGVKAAAAFSEGDILAMCEEKLRQIGNAPYRIESYDEYCYMLAVAFDLYRKQNDPESMRFCGEKLTEVPELLAALEQKTDPLAFRIDDKPSFGLSEESLSYIRAAKEMLTP